MPTSSFVTMAAALTVGGFFVFGTFHLWWLALASVVLAVGVIVYWLWTGTGLHPEKPEKDVGLGVSLPLYVSGAASVGWWGMFIMMLADVTAFVSLVFGYFFFWTIHDDFPPEPAGGPGVFWPALAAACSLGAWGLTVLARRWNRRDRGLGVYAGLVGAAVSAIAGGVALLAGPLLTGLDPTTHSYPATVWMMAIWSAFHLVVGVLMHLYCIARRVAGRMTAEHDADLCNVTLYWHFTILTVVVTVAVIGGFPQLV